MSSQVLLQLGPVSAVRAGEGALASVLAVVFAEVVPVVELFEADGAAVVDVWKLGRQILEGHEESRGSVTGNCIDGRIQEMWLEERWSMGQRLRILVTWERFMLEDYGFRDLFGEDLEKSNTALGAIGW